MYKFIKRVTDILISLILIILLLPIFLLIIIAIKLDSKGPVLFTQKRVGIHKTYFEIYKFRTMRVDTPHDAPTHTLENPEMYITKVGNFLRKTSLDELPQFINILKGDMSFVGPRPALWNQDDLVELRDKYGANDILPGLTGWAQINGRDAISLEIKAEYDGYYTKNLGVIMDLKCLALTVPSVIKRRGVVEGVYEEKSNNENENKEVTTV